MSRKPPELVTNLYRDLRDRRLLIPAAALIVALLAVPVLLSSSPTAPPPPTAETTVEPTAATPAVLAESQTGVRNYRKRLNQLKRKNPFDQQFAFPPPAMAAISELAAAGEAGAVGTGGGALSDLPLGSPVEVGGGSGGPAPAPASTSAPGDDGPSAGGASPRVERKTITRLITRRVDVLAGPAGDAQQIKGVRDLDFLPSDDAPVAMFLGVSYNAKRAAFLVSSDVVGSNGDGACMSSECQFLILRVGEERRLDFQPDPLEDPVTHRLKLLRITQHVLKRR